MNVTTVRNLKIVKSSKLTKMNLKKKKGFWTFKQNIRWWDDGDPDFSNRNDVFELKPIRDSRF